MATFTNMGKRRENRALLLASVVDELSRLFYVLKAAEFNGEQDMTKRGSEIQSQITRLDIDAFLKETFEINATS